MVSYSIPPDTRSLGTPDPANDMDAVADMLGLLTSLLTQLAGGGTNLDPGSNATNVSAVVALRNAASLAPGSSGTVLTSNGTNAKPTFQTPGGGGGVASVTAGDASAVVGGTGTNPTVESGTLDQVANLHPPTANWSNNSHKITSVATATTSGDVLPYGQAAGGDLSGTYPNPTVAKIGGTAFSLPVAIAQGGIGATTAASGRVNLGLNKTLYAVDAYGADPTGSADSTSAFAAAVAAMPTTTVNNGTTSASYPVGTLLLGTGTYKLGVTSDLANIGPFVAVVGPGSTACYLYYYGTNGDCLRAFNAIKPVNSYFGNMLSQAAPYGLASRFDGFTIDGTHASGVSCGLHAGDFEGAQLGLDLHIQNFSTGQLSAPSGLGVAAVAGGGTFSSGTYYWVITGTTRCGETLVSNEATVAVATNGHANLTWTALTGATGYNIYRGTSSGNENVLVTQVGAVTSYTDTGTSVGTGAPANANTSGSTGLFLDNANAWTENWFGRAVLYNNANAVVMWGCNSTTSGMSFEYNDFVFKIYALAGQNGVVMQGGAYFHNASLRIFGNFANSSSQTSAVLVVTGQVQSGNSEAGNYSLIKHAHLDVVVEANPPGAVTPATILFGYPGTGGNFLTAVEGVLDFGGFGSYTNWSVSAGPTSFIFDGIVSGDNNLNPAATQTSPVTIGSRAVSIGYASSTGAVSVRSGAMFAFTLSGATTITLTGGDGAARKITVVITQAPSNSYAVTWPHSGSPSIGSPTVLWAGGSAPTMTTTHSAVDVYKLETMNGATWYGQAIQAVG